MHMLAKRILKEVVTPQAEKLLHPDKDRGITMMELEHLGKVTCIAKELLEIDCLMKKLDMPDIEDQKKGTYPTAHPEAHKDMYGGGSPAGGVTF